MARVEIAQSGPKKKKKREEKKKFLNSSDFGRAIKLIINSGGPGSPPGALYVLIPWHDPHLSTKFHDNLSKGGGGEGGGG